MSPRRYRKSTFRPKLLETLAIAAHGALGMYLFPEGFPVQYPPTTSVKTDGGLCMICCDNGMKVWLWSPDRKPKRLRDGSLQMPKQKGQTNRLDQFSA